MTDTKTLSAPAPSARAAGYSRVLVDRRPKGAGGHRASVYNGTPRSRASARPGRGWGEPPPGSRYFG
jgi:hypothetical protein